MKTPVNTVGLQKLVQGRDLAADLSLGAWIQEAIDARAVIQPNSSPAMVGECKQVCKGQGTQTAAVTEANGGRCGSHLRFRMQGTNHCQRLSR